MMRRPKFVMLAVLLGSLLPVTAQPLLKSSPTQTSYLVGERLDEDMFVFDRDGEKRPVLDLLGSESKVVVLILFGGGVKTSQDRPHFRGGLWCEDSFDDLAVQRAAVHAFKDHPVQFIAVAVPPIFHSDRFGWEKDVFRNQPASASSYQEAQEVFIQNTEKLRQTGLLPFDELYFDPRFRLSMNQKEEMGEGYGPVYPWQGKLKWHSDARQYGTPTIWFLDSRGRVLAEPLLGNDYDGDPPQINYGFRELRERIQELLDKGAAGAKSPEN